MPYSLANRRASQNIVFEPRKKILVSAIGGEVFISGSYKYHVFKSTDSFRVFYRATGSTFDCVVVGGSQNGFAGPEGNDFGGTGGSGSYRISMGENTNRFNLHTGYTVTVGGAGSASTIATNSTTISSKGASGGNGGGGGGSPFGINAGCTVTEYEEENCCCFDCDNNGVTCCDGNPDCDPDPANCGCCRGSCNPGDPGYACGTTWVCPSNCYVCSGDDSSDGGGGEAGVKGELVYGGPLQPIYGYYGYGAGGGGGGGAGKSGGGPYGGNGASSGYTPPTAGGNAPANSGIGGGGGGAGADCGCTDGGCSASSGCWTTTGGGGGNGASGIVFIRYKFQE